MNTLLINIALILVFSGGFILLPCKKNIKSFGIKLLLLCTVLEIFVFNFHSFHLWFSNYEKKELDLTKAIISTETLENVENTVITFPQLDMRVGTVYLDCDLIDVRLGNTNQVTERKTHSVTVKIDAKDETSSSSYRYGVSDGVIIKNNQRSKTAVLNMSGKVSSLRISLTAENNGSFTLKGITVNSAVPMEISFFRFVLIFALLFVSYIAFASDTMQKSITEKGSAYTKTVFGITAVALFTAVLITVLYNYTGSGIVFNSLKQTSGNQISQELVDAFEAGQVTLLDKPSEGLLALENPYDWGARSEAKVSYKWDHLLYDGEYYSYYGIAPVILLFLPFHLLTGYYFPTAEAVLIFGMIGITFLSLLFYEFTKKLFPKLPLNIAIASLVTLQTSCSVWYCFASPLFYEIAQSSGFAFTCAGFYFLLKSNVITEGRIFKRHLVLSSFCLSCAVLCRPTLAVYCVTALMFIAAGFFKNRNYAKSKGLSLTKATFSYLTAALTCFVGKISR